MVTLFEGWTRKDPNAFHFNPNINSVTLNDYNRFFEIASLKQPCKVRSLLILFVLNFI